MHNGAVLSDTEIRFLSEPPNRVIKYRIENEKAYILHVEQNPLYLNRVERVENNCFFFIPGESDLFCPDHPLSSPEHHSFTRLGVYHISDHASVCPNWKPMISPFEARQVKEVECRISADDGYTKKLLSYGVSSYGYDIRSSNQFKIFTNINNTVLDPKNFDEKSFISVEADEVIIPPHSFILTRSLERFYIPRNIITICLAKSTYARLGLVVGVTPFEPEWEGYVTLEFSNTTSLPMKFYANEGCAQILFLKGSQVCETSYADRGGKYQNQPPEVVLSKV